MNFNTQTLKVLTQDSWAFQVIQRFISNSRESAQSRQLTDRLFWFSEKNFWVKILKNFQPE